MVTLMDSQLCLDIAGSGQLAYSLNLHGRWELAKNVADIQQIEDEIHPGKK